VNITKHSLVLCSAVECCTGTYLDLLQVLRTHHLRMKDRHKGYAGRKEFADSVEMDCKKRTHEGSCCNHPGTCVRAASSLQTKGCLGYLLCVEEESIVHMLHDVAVVQDGRLSVPYGVLLL
jgi:hypothetical protein